MVNAVYGVMEVRQMTKSRMWRTLGVDVCVRGKRDERVKC